MRRLARSAIVLVLTFFAIGASAQPFEVVDLGAFVDAVGVNNQGTVTGNISIPPQTWPIVWQNGTLTIVQPAGWSGGVLGTINNQGVAVGEALFSDGSGAPFTYSNGAAQILVTGYPVGIASAINDNNVIGGAVKTHASDDFHDNMPFVLNGGVMTIVATPQGWGAVRAINLAGTAIGGAGDANGVTTAGFWMPPLYGFQALPKLAGADMSAMAINSQGVIVGSALVSTSPFVQHAVMWSSGTATPVDLGVPAGFTSSNAIGINTAGQIVGYASGTTGITAWVYQSGSMHTLNELAGAATGWDFRQASQINDKGDIVGFGIPPGTTDPFEYHGFLLHTAKPTPAQMIDNIVAKIDGYGLNAGITQSLKAKLAALRSSLGRGGPSACNQLRAFVNEVKAQSGKNLTAAQAAELLAAASDLGSAIGC